jgi:hypothetical protein
LIEEGRKKDEQMSKQRKGELMFAATLPSSSETTCAGREDASFPMEVFLIFDFSFFKQVFENFMFVLEHKIYHVIL